MPRPLQKPDLSGGKSSPRGGFIPTPGAMRNPSQRVPKRSLGLRMGVSSLVCYSVDMATRETKSTRKPAAKKQPATKKTKTSAARTSTKASAKSKAVTKKPVAANTDSKVKATAEKPKSKTSKAARKLTAASLYSWNKWLALVYVIQAAVILILSVTKTLPLTTSFLAEDVLASQADETVLVPATKLLADVNVAYVAAALLVLLAVGHVLAATVYRKRYERGLGEKTNRLRWIVFGLGAGIMVSLIGMFVGVIDLSALLMLFALTVIASLTGLVLELRGKSDTLVCSIGALAGLVPWVVFSFYLIGGAISGSAAPVFVYTIFASTFLFFLSYAVNIYLQLRATGKWSDYLYAERNYLLIAFVAASALTWQLFAGTLSA